MSMNGDFEAIYTQDMLKAGCRYTIPQTELSKTQ